MADQEMMMLDSATADPRMMEIQRLRSHAHMDVSHRFRSPTLLAIGSICGILGFFLAFLIGLYDFYMHKTNFIGQPFASGHGYWPPTVSEMVSDWNSPQGRIFFGFCLIAAILLFQSWYPYELRNAYTGAESLNLCFIWPMYWITFRQIIPVVGLLMLICVSTVPSEKAQDDDSASVIVHLIGAGLMFVGYMVAEMKCLGMGFSSEIESYYLDMEDTEYCVRKALMIIVLFFYVAFCVLQCVLVWAQSASSDVCCRDVYMHAGEVFTGEGKTVSLQHAQLIDTASGAYLILKVFSYCTEVIAGLAILASHLSLWYFCEERHVHFAARSLKQVYNEEAGIEEDSGSSD